MKLFSNNEIIKDYFKKSINDNNLELELIFGHTPKDNPMNKNSFMKI